MKALITRFGGIGDTAPLVVVAEQLKAKGYEVTLAVRSDGPNMNIAEVFHLHPAFSEVLELKQFGPWGNRCVQTELGMVSINTIYEKYDLVLDYMNIIENNSTSPVSLSKYGNEWQHSRNSNWVNWIDLHLSWANVDPTSVPDSDKRPKFYLSDIEKKQAKALRKDYKKVFVVQTAASSKSRTWYQGETLTKKLIESYPECAVYYWLADVNKWIIVDKKGAKEVTLPGTPLRATMALISVCDLFIGADTGFTHIAEGLEKKHVAIYSTVPWWTRAKYYQYQTPIDPGENNPEFYTFNLGLGDPLRVIEGEAALTERELLVADLYVKGVGAKEAAKALGTDLEGAELELRSLVNKRQSFERQQSKALATVSVENVLDAVKGII